MTQVMEEVHLTTIKPRNNVLLLAQEISFAKVLACNDKRLRDRGVRRLKKWFMTRSQGSADFTKDDHMRIWKGLFYCMWMSDKPLIQEELAEEISNLVHSFASFKASLLFIETFFTSLSMEWFGIDQLRLDKFMMLVRRFMRQSLVLVARLGWPEEQVQQLADVYYKTLTIAPMGLSMHIIEVFCEELAKVGKGELTSSTILQFITVFARFMATLKDGRLISQITRYMFLHLIRQTELGVEHQMKFSAWKEYGFPGGDVDAAEKVERESDSDDEDLMKDSDEEEEVEREVGVDARAGKVDVLLPPLDFDPRDLIKVLRELRNKKETTTKSRKTLIQLITKYEKLAEGKYPLGLHKVDLPDKVDKKKELTNAAKRLYFEEQKLMTHENDTEGDDTDNVPLNKKAAKKLAKKMKKSVWKVSKASESSDCGESGSNTSWEVSESNKDTVKLKRKRKIKDNENSLSNSLNKKVKKIKVSSFSVSDSKENDFSSPVTSTPKSINLKSILKKTQSSSENISLEENTLNPKEPKSNKKLNKQNKRQASKDVMNNILENGQSKKLRQIENCPLDKTDKVKSFSETKRNKSKVSSVNVSKNILNKQSKKHNGIENSRLDNNDDTQDISEIPKSVLSKSTNQLDGEKSDITLNTSSDENNGWGGENWDESNEDLQYEMFIPNKKYVAKRKSKGLSYPVSSFVQKSVEKLTTNTSKTRIATPGSLKKVEFNLSANCSQEHKEYTKKVKSTKHQVPFDASKKPVQGLLKNSTPSPINPFYRKKLKLFTSPSNNQSFA